MQAYRWASWAQWLVLTSIATYLSLVSDPGPVFVSVWDKLLHVICWFVLLLSLRLAWQRLPGFYWGALGLFAYSTLIEILQTLNPDRQFSLGDVIANGVGIALGCVVAHWGYPMVERVLKKWKMVE